MRVNSKFTVNSEYWMSVAEGGTGQMELRSKQIVHLEIIFSFQYLNK